MFCSSVASCYNLEAFKYDNSKCENTYESCGSWTTGNKTLEGCILTKYCNTEGKYLRDHHVDFKCPDGVEAWPEDDMQDWNRQYKRDGRVWELIYETIVLEEEDIDEKK